MLEEQTGPVPVTLAKDEEGRLSAEFTAPAAPSHAAAVAAGPVARALGLDAGQIVTGGGLPCVASCGVSFLLVELASREALARSTLTTLAGLPDVAAEGVFLFTRGQADGTADLRARMYAQAHGIPEDPATGSAAAALAGFLGGRPGLADGRHAWRIAQGVEMGRSSLIRARALRREGRVVDVRIAGNAVPVAEGTVEVEA